MIKADSLYGEGRTIDIDVKGSGYATLHYAPYPKIVNTQGTAILTIIPKLELTDESILNIGIKMRVEDTGGAVTLATYPATDYSSTLELFINTQRRLTVRSNYGGPNFEFFALPAITTKEMDILFSITATKTRAYMNGYLIAVGNAGFNAIGSPSLRIPRMQLDVNGNTTVYLNSICAYLGEPNLNWSVRPSRYTLTKTSTDEHKLLNDVAMGPLLLNKDVEFEPYNPITLMYGKNDVEELMLEPRRFTTLKSDLMNLVKNDTVRTVVDLGSGRPEREFLVFK